MSPMLIAPLEVFEGNIRRLENEIKSLEKKIEVLEKSLAEHKDWHKQEEQEERWRDMGDDL